jgi:hypothetical protein
MGGWPTLRGLCERWDGFESLSESKNLRREIFKLEGVEARSKRESFCCPLCGGKTGL